MHFTMAELPPADRYRLLTNTVVPRPIAWLGTRDAQGRHNLAPFSFFNVLSSAPPILGVGIGADGARGGLQDKDSLRAIRETGEFTVALVDESHAQAMNLTATNAPVGVSEFAVAGLETGAGRLVKAPLVAGAPVSFECRVWQVIDTAPHAAIVLGEVVAAAIDDRFVGQEGGKLRIDSPAMHLIGRAHGAGMYWRGGDMMQIDRVSWPIDQDAG